jgi:hypothetical protein
MNSTHDLLAHPLASFVMGVCFSPGLKLKQGAILSG